MGGNRFYTYTWPEALGMTPWKDGQGDKVLRQDYEPVGIVSAAPMSGAASAKWPSSVRMMDQKPRNRLPVVNRLGRIEAPRR